MRLSYSVLLVFTIACLASFEGVSAGTYPLLFFLPSFVCAGHGRRLKTIVSKGKKPDPPEVKILHKIVVKGDWWPVNFKKPLVTVLPAEEKDYYFDGTLYYFIYEDPIGKFFFKDSTKFYIVLFKKTVIPSKKHHTTDSDPGVVVVKEEKPDPSVIIVKGEDDPDDVVVKGDDDPGAVFVSGDDEPNGGGGFVDVSASADAEASAVGDDTIAETFTSSNVDIGDGGISASADASGYAASSSNKGGSSSASSGSDTKISLG